MIRRANKFDTQDIIRLLKEFAEQSEIALGYDPLTWSKTRIETILAKIFAGSGVILINEEKTALLVAVINQAFWVEQYQLVEVMLHANNRLTMVKLIKEYVTIATEMKAEGRISKAIISSHKQANFEKLGFRQLETSWEL